MPKHNPETMRSEWQRNVTAPNNMEQRTYKGYQKAIHKQMRIDNRFRSSQQKTFLKQHETKLGRELDQSNEQKTQVYHGGRTLPKINARLTGNITSSDWQPFVDDFSTILKLECKENSLNCKKKKHLPPLSTAQVFTNDSADYHSDPRSSTTLRGFGEISPSYPQRLLNETSKKSGNIDTSLPTSFQLSIHLSKNKRVTTKNEDSLHLSNIGDTQKPTKETKNFKSSLQCMPNIKKNISNSDESESVKRTSNEGKKMADKGLDAHAQKDTREPPILPECVNNFQESNSSRALSKDLVDNRKGTRPFQRTTLEMSTNRNSKRVPLQRRCGERDCTTITDLEKLNIAMQNNKERPKGANYTSKGVTHAVDKTSVSTKYKDFGRSPSRTERTSPNPMNEVSVKSKSVKREPTKKAAKQTPMSWDVLSKLVGLKYKYLSGILYSTLAFTHQLDHV